MVDVVLIGGSRLFRSGIKLLLEGNGAEKVDEFGFPEEVKAQDVRREGRIVYLLKPSTERRAVRDGIAALRRADPEGCIVVMVGALAADTLVDVFAAGGDGLLVEDIEAPALHESLKLAWMGEKVFPSQLATLLSGDWNALDPVKGRVVHGPLTHRELEILRCLSMGMSNKAIALKLDVALATVKVHVKSMLKKLGVQNRTQAAIWAIDAGLVGLPKVTLHTDEPITASENAASRRTETLLLAQEDRFSAPAERMRRLSAH